MALDFLVEISVADKYTAIPVSDNSPSRQSTINSIRQSANVFKNPPKSVTKHLAAEFSTSPKVVVTTPVMAPKLFLLKYPIGM